MDDGELFTDLATRLRAAHLRVRSLTAPDEEKSSITRHLLAITEASKHDLDRASRRLDALLADLDERFPVVPGGS